MLLPLLLLFFAALSSALLAYGTHPGWAQFARGMDLILWSRQLQWPLGALALLMTVGLIGLVVSGRRRAWWLIGLGPILALFAHRFYSDPLRNFVILDNPPFAAANANTAPASDDYVVGLVFNGTPYAYPYATLYRAPVIVQADHDKRMVLLWSAFANRAVAYGINRQLYARDLEIVSMPANALLIYNTKLGQFINGVSGLTPRGEKPTGFVGPIPVEKTRWKQWLAQHPNTKLLAATGSRTPNQPLEPWFAMPRPTTRPAALNIALLSSNPPAAVPAEVISTKPVSLGGGSVPVLIFREKNGHLHVFDRRVEDLVPRFRLNADARRKSVYLLDLDTNSGWTIDGRCIDGRLAPKKLQLKALTAEEGLDWTVMKTHLPDLQLLTPR